MGKEKEFEIDLEEGYFIAPSPIGRNMDLSLRAKGLMYVFFTLPPEWDYSFGGLVAICKEGKCAVRTAINELKEAGYIDVELNRDSKGLFKYKYKVHRKPSLERNLDNNSPIPENRSSDNRITENQQELSNNKLKDINDKYDKTSNKEIKHNPLTEDLVKKKYVDNDNHYVLFLFDKLFNEYLANGKSYMELFGAIHYIVPRVVDRNFVDEEGNKINNKYGYFKTALESNFEKLNNIPNELYSESEVDLLLNNISHSNERGDRSE